MSDDIVHRGPCYVIARTDRPSGLVPYFRDQRPDGTTNHGWLDLRGHPERVALIPEAQRSLGLTEMLRIIADRRSPLMSGACECCSFDRSLVNPAESAWQVGGFVTVMYQDPERNTNQDELLRLAGWIANRVVPQVQESQLMVALEMTAEPLKLFFERTDCHALLVKH